MSLPTWYSTIRFHFSFSSIFLWGSWIHVFCFLHHCHSYTLLVSDLFCLLCGPEMAQMSTEHHPPCKFTLNHPALITAVSLTYFLLIQAFSLTILPPFPLHPTPISKATSFQECCLDALSRSNYYICLCCDWSTGSYPPSFPFSQFLQKQLFFALNFSFTKLPCEDGFSWFFKPNSVFVLFCF